MPVAFVLFWVFVLLFQRGALSGRSNFYGNPFWSLLETGFVCVGVGLFLAIWIFRVFRS